ncbi:hypothetical protein AYX22_05535 [Arthrobacter sp. D5-1]|nr:hypothetical protein AYX22_05535 [Arthrobacter sp. D5-1]
MLFKALSPTAPIMPSSGLRRNSLHFKLQERHQLLRLQLPAYQHAACFEFYLLLYLQNNPER